MPRAARYRNSAFEELERQLTFAPPDALRRQMDAAEALTRDVDAAATYPFEFVIWRLTGFRAGDAAIKPIVGQDLRADLATFVLHISERIMITHDERPGGAAALSDLAAELGVTEKTLRRWRERGLIAHRMKLADGRVRVGVFRSEAHRFVTLHTELVGDARTFTRMGEATEVEAIAMVRELIRAGRTPNLAAKETARRLGRSHETIRQLLLRTDDPTLHPRSARPGGPRERRRDRRRDGAAWGRELAYRAWRLGVAVERIAESSGTSSDAVRRRIDAVRADRLRGIRLAWTELPTFERGDAAETILASDPARSDLAPTLDPNDLVRLLATLRPGRPGGGAPGEAAEEAMLAAYNFLKREARRKIVALGGVPGRAPGRAELDRIETDLRWAIRIKRRLVERLLPVAALRIDQAGGGALERRTAEEIRGSLQRSVALVSDVIEEVDPAKRQSLRRVVSLDIDRMLAQHAPTRASRAAVRHEGGAIAAPRLFDGVIAWASEVDHLARRASALGRLPKDQAALLRRRYGWGGQPPVTLEELASDERTTVARVTARVALAERALREVAARS